MGIPFYRARELVLLSTSKEIKNPLYISEELYNTHKSKYGVPKCNDILITGVGTLGVTYLVSKNDSFYFKDGNIIWLKSLHKTNSLFIKYLYETPYIINQIFNSSNKTTVHTYTISNANNTKFPCPPSKSEQIKIVNILLKANGEIELLEQQVREEEQKKKALMQMLLTGKVRVKV